jgi:tRNA dimethylallyltransferase
VSTVKQQSETQFGNFLPLEKKLKAFNKLKTPKVILLAGPTATGKTALSLHLAQMLKGEIISVDSMQVYKGMDIGTAKVTKEQRGDIPHHLIDIRSVHEPFNVVDFYYAAKQTCESILARDKVPILVGGTGFYFRAFLYGPPSGPPSMPHVRKSLEEQMIALGPEQLFEQLKLKDPHYASTISPKDKIKIVRALEIVTLTGGQVSAFAWDRSIPLPDFDYHCWFIYRDRSNLYKAIDQRCEKMLESGLVEEVKLLMQQGLLHNPSAMQAIGYRQCLDYLNSAQTAEDFKKLAHDFKQASRQYAKRQFTWFRKEPLFKWLNMDLFDPEILAEVIAQEYYATT